MIIGTNNNNNRKNRKNKKLIARLIEITNKLWPNAKDLFK